MKNLSKKILISAIALAIGARFALVAPISFAKKPNDDGNHKVTICHRTDSVTNPYIIETVDASSVDGNSSNDNGQGDHLLDHTGPAATSQAVAQSLKNNHQNWGDIIPPFYDDGSPSGLPSLNWSAGQIIFNNGCNYIVVTPTPTNTPTPTPTTDLGNGGNNPTPTPTGTQVDVDDLQPRPADTPTPTPTPGPQIGGGPRTDLSDGLSDGRSDGLSSGGTSTAAKQGQVLGASTMAGTGTFDSTFATIEEAVGLILVAFGFRLNGKTKSK